MDRATLKVIRADLDIALEMIEKKHNLSIDVGRITFTEDSFRCKLDAVEKQEGKSSAQAKFEVECGRHGIKPEAFGSAFMSRNDTFTVCGINGRAKKYPIIAKNQRGTQYKFPRDMIGADMLSW